MDGVNLLSISLNTIRYTGKRAKITAQTDLQFSNAITDELSMQNLGRLKCEQTFPLFTHRPMQNITFRWNVVVQPQSSGWHNHYNWRGDQDTTEVRPALIRSIAFEFCLICLCTCHEDIWGSGVKHHSLLTSALEGDRLSANIPGKSAPSNYCIGSWMGPTTNTDALEKLTIFCYWWESKHNSLVVQSVAWSLYWLRYLQHVDTLE